MKKLLVTATIILLSTLVAIGCSATKIKEASKKSTITPHNSTKKPIQTIRTIRKRLPTAVASINNKAKIIEAKTYQLIKLDASSIFDQTENSKLSYKWTNKNQYTISDQENFIQKYNKKGLYEITLRVAKDKELTSINKVYILVDLDKNEAYKIAKEKGINL
jgi:hypothetical protein